MADARRLRQSGQHGITIVESFDDESLDQTGGCHFTENALHSFQASKVIITYTGYLADVFLHRQLTVQDDTEVADAGGGNGDVISNEQCDCVRSMFANFFQVSLSAEPDDLSFRKI